MLRSVKRHARSLSAYGSARGRKRADAVVAMRYDATEFSQGVTEVLVMELLLS